MDAEKLFRIDPKGSGRGSGAGWTFCMGHPVKGSPSDVQILGRCCRTHGIPVFVERIHVCPVPYLNKECADTYSRDRRICNILPDLLGKHVSDRDPVYDPGIYFNIYFSKGFSERFNSWSCERIKYED